MRTINQWLDEYGESHKNETNKLIHWICVPSIFFSITGLLYCVKLPWFISETLQAECCHDYIAAYHHLLSLPFGTNWHRHAVVWRFCLALCYVVENFLPLPLWVFCVIIFIVAWIGQFYGHKVEGKKPSFLKDIQFLLIGPMWLMSFLYKKMGIPIDSKEM